MNRLTAWTLMALLALASCAKDTAAPQPSEVEQLQRDACACKDAHCASEIRQRMSKLASTRSDDEAFARSAGAISDCLVAAMR